MNYDEHGYPDDHDPLFAAVVSAAGWAKSRGDLDAQIVLDALLEHMQEGRTDQLSSLIEMHRRPLVTPHVEAARAWEMPGEDGRDFVW